MQQVDEDKILLGFNSGKEQAYKSVFYLFYEQLFKYAYFFIKNSQESEDIVLISFSRLFSIQDKRFTSMSAIKNYIYRSVKFYCLNTIHRISTKDGYYNDYKDHLASSVGDSYEIDIELFEIKSEVVKRLHELIDELPDQCKRIFKMIVFDEMEPAEIAKQLCITTQTVYAQKNRALSFIKKNIDQNEPSNNTNTENN